MTTLNTPGTKQPESNQTIGDAVNYSANNPPPIQAAVTVVRWIIGFISALFRPAVKRPPIA